MAPKTSCLIIGAGISGCTSAIALSRLGVSCRILELRSSPSTIGGAINLTPNALKLLKDLDVNIAGLGCVVNSIEIFSYHSARKIGELPFGHEEGAYAMRVERAVLQKALLNAVAKAGVEVVYGCKVVGIEENETTTASPSTTTITTPITCGSGDGSSENERETAAVVKVKLSDGRTEKADWVLGCDGMFSAVRLTYVQPSRKAIYTGVCSAYSSISASCVASEIPFHSTAVHSGRYGSLLTTFSDSDKKQMFLAAVMETPSHSDSEGAEGGEGREEVVSSKEGWKARGKQNEKTREEIWRRYKDSAIPCLKEMIEAVEDWIFYPVHRLEPGGCWSKGRVLLLGDAAHGMPPQGESTGLAIEDAVLLSRCVLHPQLVDKAVTEVFEAYIKTRRPRVDAAYLEAVSRWENVKDKSWVRQKVEEWLVWTYLWWKAGAFDRSVHYDVMNEKIVE